MVWLVAGCVALGLLPSQFIQLIDPVTRQLVAAGLGERVAGGGWLLAPGRHRARELRPGRSSCSACAASFALAFAARAPALPRPRCAARRPGPAASPGGTARMQDTAEGFGQPIRQIFEPFFRMQRELPTPFDARAALPRRRSTTTSGTGSTCRSPRWSSAIARLIGLLQQGRIAVYLLYSFLTLVAMLLVVTR